MLQLLPTALSPDGIVHSYVNGCVPLVALAVSTIFWLFGVGSADTVVLFAVRLTPSHPLPTHTWAIWFAVRSYGEAGDIVSGTVVHDVEELEVKVEVKTISLEPSPLESVFIVNEPESLFEVTVYTELLEAPVSTT